MCIFIFQNIARRQARLGAKIQVDTAVSCAMHEFSEDEFLDVHFVKMETEYLIDNLREKYLLKLKKKKEKNIRDNEIKTEKNVSM